MDYTGLKIQNRQIRLLVIQPAPPGTDPETAPVQCDMIVRKQPLPTQPSASDKGALPSNYISFDQCVVPAPVETHVEELRLLLAPSVKEIERKQTSWASRTVAKLYRHLLRDPYKHVLTIPTHKIPTMLNPEERRKIMHDNNRRGGERRVWGEWGDIHAFEDTAGHNLFIGETTLPPHAGVLALSDLNPFFRAPDRRPESYLQYLKQVIEPDNYVAISYSWGPPEPTAEIYVNGKTVRVRANLEAALRRFRTMDYFRMGGRIWIDSLCISQEDEAEKQKQVQMMASIYRNAGNVIVWLGSETEGSEQAISWLEIFGRDYRAEFAEAFDGSDPITANTWRTMAQIRMETSYDRFRDFHLTDDGRGFLDEFAVSLYDFFDRPYWRRVWIIQELCMGRAGMPIVCGNRVTQWRYIRDGVLKYTSILDILEEVTREKLMHRAHQEANGRQQREHSLVHVAQIAQLEIMGHRRDIPKVPTESLPIVAPTIFEHGPLLGSAIRRAIALASQSECSNPHDRIYGMLNIPGLPNLGIMVDYSKTLADVFTDFSAACVRQKSLEFFALLDGGSMSLTDEHGKPQQTHKPSWAPDYGAKPARRIGIIDGEWNAGGHVPSDWILAKVGENGYLICSGKVVDTVDGTGAMSRADIEAGAMKFASGDDPTAVTQPTSRTNTTVIGDPMIYDVLVRGCDRNGSKAPESFKCLYTAFPVEEPPKHSTFYRNWHFLKSSADLLIKGRPLASYFAHLANHTPALEPTSTSPSASNSSDSTPPPKPMEIAAARQAMEARTKMRILIVTASGLLGLAPAQTRPGDAVIIIPGHGKPLIARKVSTVNGQDYWYLIGEAYVRGMMQAEKMLLSDKPWHARETRANLAGLEIIPFV